MLVFLDESGDTGRKIVQGSSEFFLVTIVIFGDDAEAQACDRRIDLLRHELNKRADYEFHFAHNSAKVRERFLLAVGLYNFTCFTVVINKDPSKLFGEVFDAKESFYKHTCNMLFTAALPYLDDATIIIDKSGSATFQGELKKFLKDKIDGSGTKIKKIKQQASHKNNLLQLADYCVGISGRRAQDKGDWRDYYKHIAPKELSYQEWPKYI
jgi:hypothetical protein